MYSYVESSPPLLSSLTHITGGMDVSEPSYTANDTDQFQGGTGTLYIYGLGFFFGFFILIIIFYITYICKSHMCSETQPPLPTTNDVAVNHQFLDDDVIMTFPTSVYSELVSTDDVSSGCAICLADYKPVDAIRLLPECGHLFHCKCIDTWLKVHPTCPVCRKSMFADVV
ncbi:RING-H2 finger protein ATL70-like [Bidens hawaiensis]|uniref:RING-H2 finger protein ATL70-like n=1 Tax=Bidens hawaiensis TaxID=980011 RepID=UPI00404A2900